MELNTISPNFRSNVCDSPSKFPCSHLRSQPTQNAMATEEEIVALIGQKGAEIRTAKAEQASKEAITALVAGLLALKNEYKVIACNMLLCCTLSFCFDAGALSFDNHKKKKQCSASPQNLDPRSMFAALQSLFAAT
jgi:hypothetical protein